MLYRVTELPLLLIILKEKHSYVRIQQTWCFASLLISKFVLQICICILITISLIFSQLFLSFYFFTTVEWYIQFQKCGTNDSLNLGIYIRWSFRNWCACVDLSRLFAMFKGIYLDREQSQIWFFFLFLPSYMLNITISYRYHALRDFPMIFQNPTYKAPAKPIVDFVNQNSIWSQVKTIKNCSSPNVNMNFFIYFFF